MENLTENKKLKDFISNMPFQQVSYYEAILWLTNPGNIRSGRTTLLALAFIQHAIHSHEWIPIFDHNEYGKKEILNRIKELLKVLKIQSCHFKRLGDKVYIRIG